jgi:hypothetical protein
VEPERTYRGAQIHQDPSRQHPCWQCALLPGEGEGILEYDLGNKQLSFIELPPAACHGLKSGQVRKVSDEHDIVNVVPYISFCTPG